MKKNPHCAKAFGIHLQYVFYILPVISNEGRKLFRATGRGYVSLSHFNFPVCQAWSHSIMTLDICSGVDHSRYSFMFIFTQFRVLFQRNYIIYSHNCDFIFKSIVFLINS